MGGNLFLLPNEQGIHQTDETILFRSRLLSYSHTFTDCPLHKKTQSNMLQSHTFPDCTRTPTSDCFIGSSFLAYAFFRVFCTPFSAATHGEVVKMHEALRP